MRKMSEKHAGNVHDFVTYLLRDHIYCEQTHLVDTLIKVEASFEEKIYFGGAEEDYEIEEPFISPENIYNSEKLMISVKDIVRDPDSRKNKCKVDTKCSSWYIFDIDLIQQWWLITPILGELLKKKGEVIVDSKYGTWWGRQSTDTLYDDEIFRKIYRLRSIKLYTNGKKRITEDSSVTQN